MVRRVQVIATDEYVPDAGLPDTTYLRYVPIVRTQTTGGQRQKAPPMTIDRQVDQADSLDPLVNWGSLRGASTWRVSAEVR